jgi:hypothetical protein
VRQAGPELDAVWRRCAPQAGISVVRDRAWVEWRYLASPSFDYRIVLAERAGTPVGYAAYRVEAGLERRIGYLAEVLAPRDDPAVLSTLVGQLSQRLQADGVELAAAQAPPGTWYFRRLRRAGFVWSWGDFSAQYVPLDASLPRASFGDVRHWTMWGGDFDSI